MKTALFPHTFDWSKHATPVKSSNGKTVYRLNMNGIMTDKDILEEVVADCLRTGVCEHR